MNAAVRRSVTIVCAALVLPIMDPGWDSAGAPRAASGEEAVAVPETLLDPLDHVEDWRPVAAPGARLEIGVETGAAGGCMRLSYDFGRTTAYVLASKETNLVLPENFEITFRVLRSAPDNNFEFKLIDADGNTWMHKWYAFASVGAWKTVAVRRGDLFYAWGPDRTALLSRVRTIEFAVTGGTGRGEVRFDGLALAPLPPGAPPRSPEAPRRPGLYPRWLDGEQAYWTLVGMPGDPNEALVCEDGAIEAYKRGFSLMPYLFVDSTLVTREEAEVAQSLERGCLPIPSVRWTHEGISLEVTALAAGPPGVSAAYARYRVENRRPVAARGTLFLAVQPYQVYPPWQGGGGISPIRTIRYADGEIAVNGGRHVYLLTEPAGFGCQRERESRPDGNVVDSLRRGALPAAAEVEDPGGFASGAAAYAFDLRPGETREVYVLFPIHGVPERHPGFRTDEGNRMRFDERLRDAVAMWTEATRGVAIEIPEAGLVDALRANVAYNLVTMDGPALQPGSRSYDKSWMRDGGIAAVALASMGRAAEAKAFLRWIGSYQQPSGEIPPIVDTKRDDPLWEERENGLVEFDAQGEFVWAVRRCARLSGDEAFLREMLPKVVKALEFLVELRGRRLGAEFRDAPPDTRAFFGILPNSTSHEGYYMKHSYWDDFWALAGWRAGREIAVALERDELVPWMEREYEALRASTYESIRLVRETKEIPYLPGCAELGDFDATATAAAVMYCDEAPNLPPEALAATFRRYGEEVRTRLEPGARYRYTPYEWRNVPALVRMGWRDEALEVFRHLFAGRRPRPWQLFAEVVHEPVRSPDDNKYIGDMPHTWVGAEFVNAVRTMLLYEEGGRLVLGAGVDPAWLDGEGVAVREMPTDFGSVSYRMRRVGDALRLEVTGESSPPEGFAWNLPRREGVASATQNGSPVPVSETGVIAFRGLPAEVVVTYGTPK